MGEVILSALVHVLIKQSTSGILRQYGKMWGSHVYKELKKLESTLSTIQAVLQDAEEKQVKNKALKKWLADLKDAAYDAEDILDEFNYEVLRQRAEIRDRINKKVGDFFSSRNPIKFRIRMIKKIKKIVERLDNIATDRSKFHLTAIGPVDRQYLITERPQTHSFVNESQIIGREEDKKKIVESLINQAGRSDVSVLPIVGIGGLGKTTIAQLVYNEKSVAEHFEQRIWVCVSEDFDIKKIVKTIIEVATEKEFKLSDMDSLQRTLRKVLSGKRFLLVLDDVWNPWEDLKELLTTGAKGSCVIVTTRSRDVASSIIGTLDAYEVKPLSKDECWSLFERNAFYEGGVENSANLIHIGKAIVEKCGGLPLAAKMLGRLMRTKRQEREWRSVMESKIWELNDDKILPSLRLSYNHLPSQVKQCFAYCAIFPKDYEIGVEELIYLWMANGFIPFDPEEDMELKGHEIFNELLARSFFQDFKEINIPMRMERRCRMHDLIHDLAQSIIGNECHILDKPESISNTTIRHLSIITKNDPELSTMEKAHTFKTLRTLLLWRGWQDRDIDVSHIDWAETKLRVLGLRRASISDLQISIHLKHLRYLDLSRTDITILPEAISSLLNLQTLNLSNCYRLRRLPKGIRKMSSLRHLYLHECSNLRSIPRGIGQLRCLRTLIAYPVGNGIGSGSIEELKDLRIGGMLEIRGLKNVRSVAEAKAANLGSKQDLQHLRLRWSHAGSSNELIEGNAEKVLEALQPPQGLKSLEIVDYTDERLPTWLVDESKLLLNLVNITLRSFTKCEHLPLLGRLPCLEDLTIDSLFAVKRMGGDDFYGSGRGGDQHDAVFPSLRSLSLSTMRDLEEWSGIEARPSFPKLESLMINMCPKLTTILGTLSPMGRWENLNSLRTLQIYFCYSLISLPVEMIRGSSSLRTLNIKNCENFIGCSSSSDGVAGLKLQYLTALENLSIIDCPRLGNFPSLHHLTALKVFHLKNCGLTALPEFPESLLNLNIVGCHNISSLPEGLGRLTALTDLQIHDLPRLSSLPQRMEGLEALDTLDIDDCPNLISLPMGLQQCLTSLKELSISNMCDLEEWSGVEGRPSFGKLESLKIKNCSTLPPMGWWENFNSLQTLRIEACDGLISLPVEMIRGLSSLGVLEISDCKNFIGCLSSSGVAGPELQYLTALEGLSIIDCPKLGNLPHDSLHHLTALKGFHLKNCGVTALPEFPESLLGLRIRSCHNISSVPEGLGRLTELENLQIQDLPKLSSLPQGMEGLKALNMLYIDDCPNLISLQHLPCPKDLYISNMRHLDEWSGIAGRPSFRKLEILTIKNCSTLLPMGWWENFNSLKALYIEACDGLISLLVEMIRGLSSLGVLGISDCKNFIGFSSSSRVAGLELQYLTALEELFITDCPKLGNFPHDSLHHLTALKVFYLINCGVTALPEFPESLLNLLIRGCHNISSLPEGIGRLTELTNLRIYDLPKLSSLPQGMEGLEELSTLEIHECPNLTSLPVGLQQRLPSLEWLHIKCCPELKTRCGTGGEYWALVSCIPSSWIE